MWNTISGASLDPKRAPILGMKVKNPGPGRIRTGVFVIRLGGNFYLRTRRRAANPATPSALKASKA